MAENLANQIKRVRERLAIATKRRSSTEHLNQWQDDPAVMFEAATGHAPQPWQADILRSEAPRIGLACGRQVGKSTITAIKALHVAIFNPGSLVLLAAPKQAQSSELLEKMRTYYRALGSPRGSYGDSQTRLEFANYSRILALTGAPTGSRGYSSPRLVAIDEAAYVPRELRDSLQPVLAASPPGSQLMCLSSPSGASGWFFEEIFADENNPDWERWRIRSADVPWIDAQHLRLEALSMTRDVYRSEYEAAFIDAPDAYFNMREFDDAVVDIPPLLERI